MSLTIAFICPACILMHVSELRYYSSQIRRFIHIYKLGHRHTVRFTLLAKRGDYLENSGKHVFNEAYMIMIRQQL